MTQKDTWDLVLESIRNSSATIEEQIAILDALQNYLIEKSKL
jgi:hypothetical protein